MPFTIKLTTACEDTGNSRYRQIKHFCWKIRIFYDSLRMQSLHGAKFMENINLIEFFTEWLPFFSS